MLWVAARRKRRRLVHKLHNRIFFKIKCFESVTKIWDPLHMPVSMAAGPTTAHPPLLWLACAPPFAAASSSAPPSPFSTPSYHPRSISATHLLFALCFTASTHLPLAHCSAAECLSPLPHRRLVVLLSASTRAGGGSIRATRSSPDLNRTLLFRWLALTLHSSPSSRRIPCTAWRREAACSAGRSCSAVALRRKLTRSSGTCTTSTLV